jgi:hypothetical protein
MPRISIAHRQRDHHRRRAGRVEAERPEGQEAHRDRLGGRHRGEGDGVPDETIELGRRHAASGARACRWCARAASCRGHQEHRDGGAGDVGSRSHGPLRRLILGSTSRRLVREAACPVLVLPRGAWIPAALQPAVAR